MPITHDLQIRIDNQIADMFEISKTGIKIAYSLEDPEDFDQKQSSMAFDIRLPATQTNDQIFNTFYSPKVRDMSGSSAFTNPRACSIVVNGVELLRGKCLLESASHTRLAEEYTINAYGQTGDWLLDAQTLTLWDCLSTTPHTFDVATVEKSWKLQFGGGFDTSEDADFVYAPVRYRQPFDGTAFNHGADDAVNIYHLRPSLSIYWLLVRGFRQLGYSINSQFLNTANYFRRMVMPWVWGSFYDINSQLTDGIGFKAVGAVPVYHDFGTGIDWPNPTNLPGILSMSTFIDWGIWMATQPQSDHLGGAWVQDNPQPNTTLFHIESVTAGSGDHYIFSTTGTVPTTAHGGVSYEGVPVNFRLNNNQPPNGNDNFGLYSFDESTGKMKWSFTPPAALAAFIGSNITANFTLNLYAFLSAASGSHCDLYIEVHHFNSAGTPIASSITHIINASGSGQSGANGCFGGGGLMGALNIPLTNPWVYNFSVPNLNSGDHLEFRLKWNASGSSQSITIASSFYMNTNPTETGANPWQYNPNTEQWQNINGFTSDPQWQLFSSSLEMTGLEIQVGNSVHFQYYDKFRSYQFLDLLRGLISLFNLSIQTDPISRVVTIEPTHDYALPDGTQMPGYFNNKILDWSDKQDISKPNVMTLFSSSERQIDFSFKPDGADGGQNIYAARYKGIYLGNKRSSSFNNNINSFNEENGIIAAVPGCSRYMFPARFVKGNRQKTNPFFTATLHYKHTPWASINELLGGDPADNVPPQLVTIFPENINDSSASSVTQTFEPRICYYAGIQAPSAVGGWRWIGDPNAGGLNVPSYTDDGTPRAIGFELPYMFAVDYTGTVGMAPGSIAPILSYCDQNINGVVQTGLMKTFFLKRLAIMRNGKQYKPWMILSLSDMINWLHREQILIDGAKYQLIGIDGFDLTSDNSSQCILWKAESPTAEDEANCFPSSDSILNSPSLLSQFDLKSAKLLLFMSDIPSL